MHLVIKQPYNSWILHLVIKQPYKSWILHLTLYGSNIAEYAGNLVRIWHIAAQGNEPWTESHGKCSTTESTVAIGLLALFAAFPAINNTHNCLN